MQLVSLATIAASLAFLGIALAGASPDIIAARDDAGQAAGDALVSSIGLSRVVQDGRTMACCSASNCRNVGGFEVCLCEDFTEPTPYCGYGGKFYSLGAAVLCFWAMCMAFFFGYYTFMAKVLKLTIHCANAHFRLQYLRLQLRGWMPTPSS